MNKIMLLVGSVSLALVSMGAQASVADACKVGGVVAAGETVDCGNIYVTNGGICDGDNDSQAPVITNKGGTIKNAKFAEGKSSKGIVCTSGTCTIDNVTFDEVCEDAISAKGDNVTVNLKNSTFKNKLTTDAKLGGKPDKFLQVNNKNTHMNVTNTSFYMVPVSGSSVSKSGKVARTCGNCPGNEGPRYISLDGVKVYGPISSIVGVNSTYRHFSGMYDVATVKNLKLETYTAPKSGSKESSPAICEEFEGIDKKKDSGDSPKYGQNWNSKSCVVSTSDVSKM